MKALGWLGTALVVLSLTSCSGKDDKDSQEQPRPLTNAQKIIGTWRVVRSKEDTGKIINFASDGTTTLRASEESTTEEKGIYTIEGDTLTVTMVNDMPTPSRIKSLTDNKLILTSPEEREAELEKLP
jgi:uncharacterized protein (TIGR03066 family)